MEEEVKLWIPVLNQEMELSKLELKVGNYFLNIIIYDVFFL